ncbi:MAG: PTS sugar transporter subunit IIA [Acidaminococcaceae bacterium]|nr:PTS sugar transporter subunit IIA [Acidaminococcaceae bacterium]
MRITDLLKPQSIDLNAVVADKPAAVERLVDLMEAGGNLADKALYKARVLAREAEGSTGIGEGIAIPHAKTEAVKAPGLASMIVRAGVDYESLDEEPAFLFFLIAAPAGGENVHLEVLSRLSRMLMDDEFHEALMNAKTPEEYLQIIDEAEKIQIEQEEAEAEEERKQAEAEQAAAAAAEKADGELDKAAAAGAAAVAAAAAVAGADSGKPFVAAVTACPTGIAHTYMAAEALERKASAMGIDIKVETNGSGGVKNTLTAADIERAAGIIVACDKNVPVQRFAGKKVLFVKVSAGIKEPENLINTILKGEAPVFNGESAPSDEPAVAAAEGESVGRQIYKHLMNGVSHMLPFVIGGGILIALAFLFDMGNAGTAQFGSGTPLAAFLKNIGGLSFSMMMPILAGYIAMSIGERPALMPGVVGGFLAVNGGSGFFGALFAGFIAGYLVNWLKKVLSGLPQALEGTKPVLLYPVLGLLLMGIIMTYIINPPTAMFNKWLADVLAGMSSSSKVILGFILGGMMSIDFGGPINKAAYVFGTASLAGASGQAVSSGIMASVMIGGMVPPIAIALCTLLFKKKFTKQERSSCVTNFIMGFSFITEGAIPFAASDPLHVIPACAIGSAVAGALSMLFNCTVPAPHGGLFVFGVVTNWPMYFVALAIGALVACFILGFTRKDAVE